MTESSLESLLEPSLQKHTPRGALYSIGAHVIVAFFGGPVALMFFSMWGAYKINKLKEHWLLYILGLLAGLALLVCVYWMLKTGWPSVLEIGSSDRSSAVNIIRIGSIFLSGYVYLGLRDYFRVGEVAGEAPSPWVTGIAAVVVGYLITRILIMVAMGAGS